MQYPNLNDNFRSIGNDFRNNIPHIVIGNKGISTNNNIPKNIYPNQTLPNKVNYYRNIKPVEEDVTEKVKKWALIITICIVIGYAGWRILNIFIGG